MLRVFSTKAGSRHERSQQWCAFTRADHVEIHDDREASLRGIDFGHVRLCYASLGRHKVVQESVGESGDAYPALKFFLQEEGTARITQSGRTIELHPGEWCAMRKDIPYTLDSDGFSRQLAITLPCEMIPAPRPGFAWWGKARSFLRGPARILHASASASVMAGTSLTQDDCGQIGTQITELLRMMLREDRSEASPDLRERRRLEVMEHIERNLTDPGMNVQTIARALGCSTRTLHKLFEGEANSVSRIIWERRLERSRSQLVDPAFRGQSITEIAHYWGFSDSQHFSRAFRSRFGTSPRECRNSVLH